VYDASIEYANSSIERPSSLRLSARLKNKTIRLSKLQKLPKIKDNDKVANGGSGDHTDGAVSIADAPQVQQNPMNYDAEASEGNMVYSNADVGYHEVPELTNNNVVWQYSHDEVAMDYDAEASEGNMMYSDADVGYHEAQELTNHNASLQESHDEVAMDYDAEATSGDISHYY